MALNLDGKKAVVTEVAQLIENAQTTRFNSGGFRRGCAYDCRLCT